ncbi:hypothetical protein JXO59_12920 [candidate division KSB1 bacterium]|nr:hypothetical protein [candidate division KSB1 bacterium]
MMHTTTINWAGASGNKYLYWIYPIDASIKDHPGNFILSKRTQYGFWIPCFVGETEHLKKCLRWLENDSVVRRFGATHVHVHLSAESEAARKAEVQDLLRMWNPFGNEIMKYADKNPNFITMKLQTVY